MTILTAGGLLIILTLTVADLAALEYPIASLLLLASIRRVAPTGHLRLAGLRRASGGAR